MKVAIAVLRSRNKQLETTNNENFWSQGMVVRDIVFAMEEQAKRFALFIVDYKPTQMNNGRVQWKKDSEDGGYFTTQQLYDLFNKQG